MIIEAFRGMQGVEEVKDQLQYLEPLFSALTVATYIAVGIAALMLIAAVLLIATTIRLSAYARRRELGIMRLVGASNRFIQTPFILEGVFAALIGSLLASGAVLVGVQFGVNQYLRSRVDFVTTWVGSKRRGPSCRSSSSSASCSRRCRRGSRSVAGFAREPGRKVD